MSTIENTLQALRTAPQSWLVTGVAGFIGSHLAEALLKAGQQVTGVDNFATGKRGNIDQVKRSVTGKGSFRFIEGDIRNPVVCQEACRGVQLVLHEAALGSVPRSMIDPQTTTEVNVNGTLSMLIAARDAGVRRFVYASSSSVYGDIEDSPKREEKTGNQLSPYAVSKYVNELYAGVFARAYGLETVGLRYFNVFGPRQDPAGEYAAVVPRWLNTLLADEQCTVYGDGKTSRDFCYIENVVSANILAATTEKPEALNRAYNIACGESTSLLDLYEALSSAVEKRLGHQLKHKLAFAEFRAGDVRHSLASIDAAKKLLGFEVLCSVPEGLARTVETFRSDI